METIAYIYKWTHLPSMKWYIGSRTRKNCHPEDGYICSSKIIKPLIIKYPADWQREILFVGISSEIRELEGLILSLFDAKKDPRSFNQDNGDGKFVLKSHSESAKQKMRKPKKESSRENYKIANRKKAKDPEFLKKLKKPKYKGFGEKISKALTGISKSESHKSALSISQKLTADKLRTGKTFLEIYGYDKSKEMRQKMSASQKGKPCNNPIVTCPHCDKTGHSGAMKLWHFDKCKMKK